MNKVELLAPAGNKQSFIAAINAGADAVYMGIDKYNARNMAENFGMEQYIDAIKYAHKRGVKVYLTLNTLLTGDEVKEATSLVMKLYSKGLDAVIVQDLGLAMLLKKAIPNIELHASTQMSVYSLEGVKYLESLGFKRVVLARELTIKEIEEITKNTNVEIEVFVHGALCVCVSGQCQMSALIGDRSANKGTCAQPCRQQYTLIKNGKEIIKNKYLLSKKDIYGLEDLEKLVEIGVKSLKIEGRNRTPEYVAATVKAYRKSLDNKFVIDKDLEKETLQLFNRSGKSYGYLKGIPGKESISHFTPKNTGLILGKVLEYNKPYIKVKLEEKINLHDGIEIYSKTGVVGNIVTHIKNITKKEQNREANEGDIVLLGDIKQRVNEGDIVYKTSDNNLNKKLKEKYFNNEYLRKQKVNVQAIFSTKGLVLKTQINGNEIKTIATKSPEPAIKSVVSKEELIESLSKCENLPYSLNVKLIEYEEGLFLPKSIINETRRNLVDRIDKEFEIDIDISKEQENLSSLLARITEQSKNVQKNNSINSLYVYNYDKARDYIELYNDRFNKRLNRIYLDIENIKDFNKYVNNGIEVILRLPNMSFEKKENLHSIFENNKINGLLVSNIADIKEALVLKKRYNMQLVVNYTLNITNKYTAIFLKELGFDEVILGVDVKEEDVEEISKIIKVSCTEGLITAMTSRYCIVKSFDTNTVTCNMQCKKCKYELKDNFGKIYNIVCDNKSHIMKLVRNNSKKMLKEIKGISTIYCILE